MGTVFLHGNGGSGGGGGLNFKVVGNPKPKNPTEGIVWVNTDADITGYFLSAEQPENPTAGMLWIKISDSSNIKVGTSLGKDYITIMLDSVSQYIGGQWVDVEAKSFQNGVWVEWFEVLYPYGKLSTWAVGYKQIANGSLTISNGDLVLTSTSTGSGELRTVFYGDTKIDVTDISEFIVNMTIVANRGSWRVALVSNATETNPQGNTVCEVQNEGTGAWEAKLDVSNVSGAYYFAIYYTSWSATAGQTHTANVHTIKDH